MAKLWWFGAVAIVLTACGPGMMTVDSGRVCTPNATSACVCWNGGTGTHICNATGTEYLNFCDGCTVPTDSGVDVATNPCAGRECGTNGTGGSCGTCQASLVCNASGHCVAATCVPIGNACTAGSACCNSTAGTSGVCVTMAGAGTICAASCTTMADCADHCCVGTSGGTSTCAIPQWCPSATCSFAAFGACGGTTDSCCQTPTTDRPTTCTMITGGAYCEPLCTSDADCDAVAGTGNWACVARTDHVMVCVPR